MKIIVGLGNPGKEYENTRHNAGFMLLDELVKHKEVAPVNGALQFNLDKKFEALICETKCNGEKVVFVKPQTFMNLSGRSVSKILNFYKSNAKDLIVVLDDVDLPVGISRIRREGSSGGQKGLQNIIDSIGDQEFTRIRIGIGPGEEKKNSLETAEYVLDKIDKRELAVIGDVIKLSVDYLIEFLGSKKEITSHSIESNNKLVQ